MAVDPDGNRLYWFDEITKRIEVVTFDGQDRTLLLKSSSPISTLTIQGTQSLMSLRYLIMRCDCEHIHSIRPDDDALLRLITHTSDILSLRVDEYLYLGYITNPNIDRIKLRRGHLFSSSKHVDQAATERDRTSNATAMASVSGALRAAGGSSAFELQKQRVWSPPASSGDHLAHKTARAVAIVAVKEAYQFMRRSGFSSTGSGANTPGAHSWALVARDFVGASDRCSRKNCSHICLTYDATIGELVCGCPSGMRLAGWRPSANVTRSFYENASSFSRLDSLTDLHQCESWTPVQCPAGEFMCLSDGHCIPQHYRCDSIPQCFDGMCAVQYSTFLLFSFALIWAHITLKYCL